jgi:chorismate mutase / prephenate dehydratase
MNDNKLNDLRRRIDELDNELLSLLNKRMLLSQQIGRIKINLNQEIFDQAREQQVIVDLLEKNRGPILEVTLKAIYREIFSGSRALQEPQCVAFLGPLGTFSHLAVLNHFGESVCLKTCKDIPEIFEQLNQNSMTSAVVPLENSIEGSIRETLDQLMLSSVRITGEIALKINQSIMSLSGQIKSIKYIISHPQALAQCRTWIHKNVSWAQIVDSSSTAKAAEIAMNDAEYAAIGNEHFGRTLGLQIISRAIQDRQENFTRFLILNHKETVPSGKDKTSLVFWTEDKPGALFTILGQFAQFGINLSRIESRPDRGITPWKYAFFVDLTGHLKDENVARCLREVEKTSSQMKILGSFPMYSYSDEPV